MIYPVEVNIKNPENNNIIALGHNFNYYWYTSILRVQFILCVTNFFWILNPWGLLICRANLH